MKKIIVIFAILLPFMLQAQSDFYFATTPALNPEGTEIIFSYDGDLWKVAAAGGTATRLTAMAGDETYPRVSPDGQWIAFSSAQYGNTDIYLMPYHGGEIKRLTYHASTDQMEAWSWDSKTIYFRSSRYNNHSAYTVSIEGGTPKRVFGHYFNWPHNLAIHPDGSIYFNESFESSYQVARKRYKGAFNPDIKSYNPANAEYKEHTSYNGKDIWASIDRNGQVYYVSDESNGEYNLYELDNGRPNRLTNFKTSIKTPQVNANGGKVVYERDYQIYLFDASRKRSSKVKITTYENSTLAQERDFNTKGNISNFDISPDEKKMAFVSRGELFVSDISGKFIKQLATNPGERVIEVRWLKDNQTLLYTQTLNGYANLYTINAAKGTSEKQLTKDDQSNRNLDFNPEMTQAVYLSGINEVRLLDLESMRSETIANEELWGRINSPQPRFSPDGQYIAFVAQNQFENDIYLYHIASKRLVNYTDTGVSETSPFWGPGGKYLYFVSNRTRPSFPYGLQNSRVYRVPLSKIETAFKSDKLAEVFDEDKKEKDTVIVNIDFTQNLIRSMQRISPDFGSQSDPYVIKSGNKTQILYFSNHDESQRALWMTTIEPFQHNKTEKLGGTGQAGGNIIKRKNNYYIRNGGTISKINLGGKSLSGIETNFTFRRSMKNEFEQMYYETWAGIEENFYNETFHGMDWAKLKTRYAHFLPHLRNRKQLRTLLNDLLGELNSSHMGFWSSGNEENTYYNTRSLNLGLIFSKDNPYKINRVVAEGPADFPDKDIRTGDVLKTLNGENLNEKVNREYYLAKPSLDEEVTLGLQRGSEIVEVKIHPRNTFSLLANLYDEWTAGNRSKVKQATNERVAYVHMKNMMGGSLQQFLVEMTSEGYKREGLILDLRYNTGGNVHDEVLKFLSQKPYMQWKFREGKLTQSNFGVGVKPMVLLINKQSLSDAELMAQGFKQLGLGTIIGTNTYGWVIFTSGTRLVDGSSYRLPSWGCYTLDGKNLEKQGVKPDIYVETNFADRLNGRDPQLDKAIEEILKKIN